MKRIWLNKAAATICIFTLAPLPGRAWSNRGHRMINLVAAESLPPDMPAFMLTPAAAAQIAYLGPEPDRWRPEVETELSAISGPDHVFRLELGALASPLPRRRNDFVMSLEALRAQHPSNENMLRPEGIGTLPWQAEEVYERLQAAFRSYRIANGLAKGDPLEAVAANEVPITREDLPQIEASVLFYAGWLGHYIGDGSMPLHDSINIAGWKSKDNPNGYTTKGSIHHDLEQVADNAIEQHLLTDRNILPLTTPAHLVDDPFAATLAYLQKESTYVDAVYRMEKQGAIEKNGTPELDTFMQHRMAEGGSMLRDLVYTAWIRSKDAKAPELPKTVNLSVSSSGLSK
jgi:hypothetical protein